MKRTHYTVKAQRARKAWKRLKEQTRSKTDNTMDSNAEALIDHKITELVFDL